MSETVEERVARERPDVAELVRLLEAVRAHLEVMREADGKPYHNTSIVTGSGGDVTITLQDDAATRWLLGLGAERSEWYGDDYAQRNVRITLPGGVVLRGFECPHDATVTE